MGDTDGSDQFVIRLVVQHWADRNHESRCPKPCRRQPRKFSNTSPTPTCDRQCWWLQRSGSSAWKRRRRFYQASISELYGSVREVPQKETTPYLSASSPRVWRRQALRLLDHGNPLAGLRACSPPTASCSIMKSLIRGETFATWARSRAASPVHRDRLRRHALPSEISRPSATGAMLVGLCRGHAHDLCRPMRLTIYFACWQRRDPLGARVCRTRLRRARPRLARIEWRGQQG